MGSSIDCVLLRPCTEIAYLRKGFDGVERIGTVLQGRSPPCDVTCVLYKHARQMEDFLWRRSISNFLILFVRIIIFMSIDVEAFNITIDDLMIEVPYA
jgi:hypothetical protein